MRIRLNQKKIDNNKKILEPSVVNLSGFSKIGSNIMGSGSIPNFKNNNTNKKEELNLFVRNTKPIINNNKGNGLSKEGEDLFNKLELNISNNNSFEENGGNFELHLHDNFRIEKNGKGDITDNLIMK